MKISFDEKELSFWQQKKEDISDLYWDIRHKIRDAYRAVKTYLVGGRVLIIKDLDNGWCDKDHEILHANFQILTNFVEVECASMFDSCGGKDYVTPVPVTARDKGLAYLNQDVWVYKNSDHVPSSDEKSMLDRQRKQEREIRNIYLWWKDERPKRIDPFDLMPNNDEAQAKYAAKHGIPYTRNDFFGNINFAYHNPGFRKTKAYKNYRADMKKVSDLEQAYDDEDTAMLVRLMKIRRKMWT